MKVGIVQERRDWQEHSTKEKSMQGAIYKDATGREFIVRFVDHNMNGSWVHYSDQQGQQYNCLIDAFKERFTKVENTR